MKPRGAGAERGMCCYVVVRLGKMSDEVSQQHPIERCISLIRKRSHSPLVVGERTPGRGNQIRGLTERPP
jgi:hypothetical protein